MKVSVRSNDIDQKHLDLCLKGSPQAMVYGWSHCSYFSIRDRIENGDISAKKRRIAGVNLTGKSAREGIKVFRCNIGKVDSRKTKHHLTTVDKRVIEQLPVKNTSIESQCKMAITNLILENYKRAHEGLKVIPLIFIVDAKKSKQPITSRSILTRKTDYVTNKEIRRCYRHVQIARELEIPEQDKALGETFQFVTYSTKKNGRVVLKKTQAPWEAPEWEELWQKRMDSRPKKKTSDEGSLNWKDHFKEALSREV